MKLLAALIKPKNFLLTLYFIVSNALIFFACGFLKLIDLGVDKIMNQVYNGLIGLGINLVFMLFSLSLLGEGLSRLMMRWKPVESCNIDPRFSKMFDEVYNAAKAKNPKISGKIKLYIAISEDDINAFALGKRSIALTNGTVENCDDETIKGLLAHEFGHIYNNDSSLTLGVLMSNQVIMAVSLINVAAVYLVTMILTFVLNAFTRPYKKRNMLGFALASAAMMLYILWTKLGMLVLCFTRRKCEYAADAFGVDIGYGNQLHYGLSVISPSKTRQSMTALLSSTHPDTVDRLDKIAIAIKENPDYQVLADCDKLNSADVNQNFDEQSIAATTNENIMSEI